MGMTARTAFWCFTRCNYSEEDEERIKKLFEATDETSGVGWIKRGVVGREVAPTTGMRHLQGFLHLGTRRTRQTVEKMIDGRAWLGSMRGTEYQARMYPSKDGDILVAKGRAVECAGRDKQEKQRQEWREAMKKRAEHARTIIADCKRLTVEEFVEEHPNDWLIRRAVCERLMLDYRAAQAKTWDGLLWHKNVWMWGSTGTGKSRWASEQESQDFTYRKHTNKWSGGFSAERSARGRRVESSKSQRS
jgi:hypothetical protein